MHARFEPLPSRNSDADTAAKSLRDRHGEWAHVDARDSTSRAANLAYRIRAGLHSSFRPAGAYEARSQGTDVWARYVGPRAEAT
ncbi:hypothetical protein OG730_04655 [Streptomyces sp. NBC_01298]|uniref:hypothetical protein n=1 Tax=Streptomyces sp. NBC_01298 TaxID=2903817 RepID=UPI002E10BD50|nr:hypothetical protein OG730_04655 [Streptomyces sp. NBC_01298]